MTAARAMFRCLIAAASVSVAVVAVAQPAIETAPADKEFSLPALPPPPASALVQSPVQLFRELLAMSPAEQREFLADRPAEQQKRILAKLAEYEALRPNQRELRLRVTELHWYLWPLLGLPATNRPAQLAAIPDDQRKLVEDRLQEWDKLSAAARTELLDNAAALRYFTQVDPAAVLEKPKPNQLTPRRANQLQAGIARWQALPEEQRRKMLERFNRFFDLTPAEKTKALSKLSDEERRQMERTLKKYQSLPAETRAECVEAFSKFTALSLEERQQFLKNAERWRLMSPDERQNWRELVQKLPADGPPSPPGLRPPMPPVLPDAAGSAVATNGRK